jgi:pimeloyl-ACP methyl ester carboxylesterase
VPSGTEQIEVQGLRVAYERAGQGPPLILLHGYVGDSRGTWGGQLDALSDDFTVVAWDAPGVGLSSDPPDGFRLPDYADCLAGFVDALGLGQPHVAGLSFGGALALELYRRHPALPNTLVLASAYAGWSGSLPRHEVERRLRQVLELADLPPDGFVREVIPTLFSEGTPAETIEAFAASASGFHPPGLRAMARSMAEADLRDVLPRIDVPTLLLYGGDDVRAPRDVAEGLRAAIPTARLVVFPGIGHLINLEACERLNAEIRAFLRSRGRVGG